MSIANPIACDPFHAVVKIADVDISEPLRLCHLDDIPDGQGRGFTIGECGNRINIFLVRRGRKVYAYRNLCPHKGLNLDWQPDQFLDPAAEYIHCSNHDALFRVEDGVCIAGPCRGAQLKPVNAYVSQDHSVSILQGRF